MPAAIPPTAPPMIVPIPGTTDPIAAPTATPPTAAPTLPTPVPPTVAANFTAVPSGVWLSLYKIIAFTVVSEKYQLS